MKLDSQDLLNLLADARERHGAPCRVEVTQVWDRLWAYIYYRDWQTTPVEMFLI